MSQPNHPSKDGAAAPARTTISFGLTGAAARRPGLSKATTAATDTAQTTNPAAAEETSVLVIPLPAETSTAGAVRSETARAWEAYDPHKIGLQVRRPLGRGGEDGESLSPRGTGDGEEKSALDVKDIPFFLKRCRSPDPGEGPSTIARVSLEAYAKVPVDQFGAALLRGMGWREGEGVGRRRRERGQQGQGQDVKIVEPRVRPRGLGLGAAMRGGDVERGGAELATAADPSHAPTVNFARTQSMVGVGSHVRLRRGAHAGERGTVTKVLAGEAQVRLSPSGTLLVLDHEDLQAIDGDGRQSGIGDDKGEPSPSLPPSWLRPHIRVQFATKRSLRLAMHHGRQGDVLDVHQGLAIIRMPSGALVADVRAGHLRPSLPVIGEAVLVLAEGRHQGAKGVLLGTDGPTAHVQLLDADEDNGYGQETAPGTAAEPTTLPPPPHSIISLPIDSIAPCTL